MKNRGRGGTDSFGSAMRTRSGVRAPRRTPAGTRAASGQARSARRARGKIGSEEGIEQRGGNLRGALQMLRVRRGEKLWRFRGKFDFRLYTAPQFRRLLAGADQGPRRYAVLARLMEGELKDLREGLEITELASHLQGQLVAVHPASRI